MQPDFAITKHLPKYSRNQEFILPLSKFVSLVAIFYQNTYGSTHCIIFTVLKKLFYQESSL